MPALLNTAVTINRVVLLAAAGTTVRVVNFTAVLTNQGTVANSITASVLGLTSIFESSSLVASDNSAILVSVPSADGTKLLLKAAATGAPADYAGTFTGNVTGY
jgi:hypothetical protein